MWGSWGTPCRVTPEELHLSLPAELPVFTPWHPSGLRRCFSSVDHKDGIIQPPRLPPSMLCQLHLSFRRHISGWMASSWYTGSVQRWCRVTCIKRYWLPSTIKKCFSWVVCQLPRACLIVSKPFTSQQAPGADRLIYLRAFVSFQRQWKQHRFKKRKKICFGKNVSLSDAFIQFTVWCSCGLARTANQMWWRKSHTRPPLFPLRSSPQHWDT